MIEELKDYTQVNIGDFFQSKEKDKPILTRVCETTDSYFYYYWCNYKGLRKIRGIQGNQLEEVILIRCTEDGAKILAGKNIYNAIQDLLSQMNPEEHKPLA